MFSDPVIAEKLLAPRSALWIRPNAESIFWISLEDRLFSDIFGGGVEAAEVGEGVPLTSLSVALEGINFPLSNFLIYRSIKECSIR